jgi:hypothetical protein
MQKINKLSLYIVNNILFLRLVIGKSAYDLSIGIKKNKNYVSHIEDKDKPDHYNSADFAAIADELECKIHDFIPSDEWDVSDSHAKVEKVVDTLKDPRFAKRVISAIYARNTQDKALESIENLYGHFHLKSEKVEERKVVKEVWEKFLANNKA